MFMLFQISLASRYVSTFSLTVEFVKTRRAKEESSTLISKLHKELYSVENTINDNTAVLLRKFYKYFIYNSL